MKQNFTRLIVAAFLLITAHSGFSQVSENFNTRPGALNGADIKSHLMSKGWEFNSANVSMTSVLEGDASVETSALSPFGNHGIISPLLKVEGNSITVGFTYQYKNGNGGNHTFYIHLVNCAGDWIQMLGSATTPDISTPSSFSQTFGGITPGEYRVFINFQGMGMANAVIDDVNISGPMRYVNGVNTAPVGVL
jgi:hypothetical protein